MVKVKLSGPFVKYMPEKDDEGFWNIDIQGMTVEGFLQTTPVKDQTMDYSIVVNGKTETKEYVLKEGDSLKILPIFHAG